MLEGVGGCCKDVARVLQDVAGCCSVLRFQQGAHIDEPKCHNEVQGVAICRVLQRVQGAAGWCKVLHGVAWCYHFIEGLASMSFDFAPNGRYSWVYNR